MSGGVRMPVNSFSRKVDLGAVGEAFRATGFDVLGVERTARKVAVSVRVKHHFGKKGEVSCFATFLFDDEGMAFHYAGVGPEAHYYLDAYCQAETASHRDRGLRAWRSLHEAPELPVLLAA